MCQKLSKHVSNGSASEGTLALAIGQSNHHMAADVDF